MIMIFYIFYMIMLTFFFDMIIVSNMISIIMLNLLFNFNFLNWSFLFMNFGINFYSNGLIFMMLWIFLIITMNFKLMDYTNYCILMNIMLMSSMFLMFISMNLLTFYFMFESSLLIIFYMIMKWGYGEMRFNSSFYLMFYTLIFSLPMLYIMFNILMLFNTMNFYILEMINFFYINEFKFLYLIMSFLVKIPIYMIHSWLLKAHVEASFFSSMILASVMLKLGGYGMMRLMFIMKMLFKKFYFYIMMINMFGMIMLSLMCMSQMDFKLIIAISSIVHMSIMMMGMLLMTKMGFYGSFYMMISHGFVSSGLFYLTNLIYMKTNSRIIYVNKGIINIMPSLMMFFSLMCFCNVGSPFSLNLISEVILLISLINWFKYVMLILMFYCTLSFVYSIYLFSFICQGKVFMNFISSNFNLMNYLSLTLHMIPLNIMFFNIL
uniref:NADH dehydrogenase subunit 4 n=1 Tax=Geniotrigona thoracica TaxID=395500 RepID=UPI003D53E44E